MRSILLILLTFFWFNGFSQAQKAASISGTIINPSAKTILIGDSLVSLSPKGTFECRFEIIKPAYFELQYNDKVWRIFITPAEQLLLTFDAREFDRSLKYKGPSSQINYILLEQTYTDLEVNNYFNYKWRKLFSKEENEFIKTIDSLKGLYLRTLNAVEAREESLNKDFVFDLRNDVNFGFDRLILIYPQQHLMFTGKNNILSASTIQYLDSINLGDPELLGVANYKKFGNEWIDWKIRNDFHKNDSLRKKDNQWLSDAFMIINSIFHNGKTRQFWLYFYLSSHIENQGVKNLEEYVEIFNALSDDSALKEQLNKQYRDELQNRKGHLVKTYKSVDSFELDAHIFKPDNLKGGEKRPAMVYFHGGSWSEGKPDWHFGKSELGLVNISVEYRTYGRHGVLPFQQVSDVKSMFRWLRKNANELNIDPNKIIASGNSAGGHLILCAAMLDTLDEAEEDLSVSSRPDLLILNSAIFDLEGFNWFDYLLENRDKKKAISPIHHIKRGLPPMLVFHGTNDRAVPIDIAKTFVEKTRAAGNKIDFYPIGNAEHELWFNKEYLNIAPSVKKDFLRKYKFM